MNNETFPTFNDIDHIPLRVYNRVVMMSNINQDFGVDTLREYISNFSEAERKQMYLMQAFIQKHGPDNAMKLATANMEFKDDVTIH